MNKQNMNKQKALIEGILQDVISYLVEDDDLSIEQSMDILYKSTLSEKLLDIETGLYRESSAYVYGLLKDEIKNGKFIQNEI